MESSVENFNFVAKGWNIVAKGESIRNTYVLEGNYSLVELET